MSLRSMVENQVARVITRGQRAERFDRLRNRHFWSSYFFVADPVALTIPAGAYDLFKTTPAGTGQGYPTNVPLTIRETNWLNAGRVPDNQNFVITEIGVTVKRPPSTDGGGGSGPGFPPTNGIWYNLTPAQQAFINAGAQNREVHPIDTMALLYGGVLEMSFLTNNVPLGLLADFSQSAGSIVQSGIFAQYPDLPNNPASYGGDAVNGVACAAFRRRLEVPILLQHGENMGMRINFPRPIQVQNTTANEDGGFGTGWFEIRVDWWAYESFVDLS